MKMSQSKGQEGDDNTFISGMATETPAERETNSTQQYTTGGGTASGPLGGENKNN